MPLPDPSANESKDEFISRCMGDPATQDITGDSDEQTQERRLAACFNQWREPEKSASPEMETKVFGHLKVENTDRGEVTAIVATLGVVDHEGDVILPGAFPKDSLVKMSGYDHDIIMDGAPPVGKGTISEEGDRAMLRGNFFMSTERGREAFYLVRELGTDGEWSFGYPRGVKTAELTDEWRSKGARRIIAGLLPLEASPVFRGAGIGTQTVSTKATPLVIEPESDPALEAQKAANEWAGKKFTRVRNQR